MKKTIVALAAVTSVALSSGVAVAEEAPAAPETITLAQENNEGAEPGEKAPEDEAKKDENTGITGSSDKEEGATGSSDLPELGENFKQIGAIVGTVVSIIGGLATVINTIMGLVKKAQG